MKAERGQLSQPNQPTQPIPVAPPKRPQTAARDLNCRYGNSILDLWVMFGIVRKKDIGVSNWSYRRSFLGGVGRGLVNNSI